MTKAPPAQLPLFLRIPDTENLKARFTAALIRRMSSAYYLSGSLVTRCAGAWNQPDQKEVELLVLGWGGGGEGSGERATEGQPEGRAAATNRIPRGRSPIRAASSGEPRLFIPPQIRSWGSRQRHGVVAAAVSRRGCRESEEGGSRPPCHVRSSVATSDQIVGNARVEDSKSYI